MEYVLVDDLSIAFNISAEYRLDAAELEKLDETSSSDELIAVLSEYQGELLPGFYDEWVTLEREHLNSIFEYNMARLMSVLQDEKRWPDIFDWGERWIKLGQKPEPAYRALMSAHAAHGDMSKVAATYERCVKSLKEFGIEPSEQTRALYERLKMGKETFEAEPTIAVREKHKGFPKTNLPIPITSFIGREKEIEEIIRLVGEHRLVTLTGPGGVGKTRLAIQSSNRLLSKFNDGVWWVELAPLTDHMRVPHAVAQALGVRELSNQPLIESLKSFLREKQLLLVLDNCEHLISPSAQLAFDLLSHCANLRIMTTSREPLGITGEILYPVPTLSFPKMKLLTLTDLVLEYESIRLFVERARAVKSDFVLTEKNSIAVVQICQRLDGISLALELAAARTRLLSVEEIADRLNDRFNLLTQGSRTALPRHQTLRAAIDWSHNLLPVPEQVMFRRLAIFVGGFTLEAVESVAVGGDVPPQAQIPDLLEQLIDKSLVTVRVDSEDSETRYDMLETIREYAREKLDESGEIEQLRQHHRDYFIAFAEQAEPKLKGAEQFEWLDRLEVEHDNLRAAWNCAIETESTLALRLAAALFWLWVMQGDQREGREWLAILIDASSQWGESTQRAHMLGMAGWLANYEHDSDAARRLLKQALASARSSGDKKEIAFALLGLGNAYRQQGDQTGWSFLEEALTLYQELQDEWNVAWSLVESTSFSAPDAEQRFLQSLAKFQELGDKSMVGGVLFGLGELMQLRDDYERAGKYYEENLEILRGSQIAAPEPISKLAWVSLHTGDHRRAQALFEEVLRVHREDGDKNGLINCIAGFAAVFAMTGKPEQAACLFGAAQSLFEALGMAGYLDPPDQKEFDHYLALVRSQLDEATFAEAWEEGHAMTLEQATEFALNETN
jgi:non-specific serine/threonine protein kinase